MPYDTVKHTGVTALNIQLFLMAHAMSNMGHDIAFLPVVESNSILSHKGVNDPFLIESCKKGNFSILSPIIVNEKTVTRTRHHYISRIYRNIKKLCGIYSIRSFYPAINMGTKLTEVADQFKPDILLAVVSPHGASAIATVKEYPTIIFQGDIDFMSDKVRLNYERLFHDSSTKKKYHMRHRIAKYIRRRRFQNYEKSHKYVSLCADAIVSASANNVQYYKDMGHPKVTYVGTTWTNQPISTIDYRSSLARDGSIAKPFKIIGHVGFLNSTASTFGLEYLLQKLMPELHQEMKGYQFEVHIIGGGALAKPIQAKLKQKNVIVRGYVEDLDVELMDSNVFLFLNNVGPAKAIFSRQIMAWALGLCLVVHEGSKEALPELEHGKNALVGASASEIASLVRSACLDKKRNRKLCEGGRDTFDKHFTPLAISKKIIAVMKDVVK